MHILAVIMLHQHKFCVYKGKRKLKLLITCEDFVLFAVKQFLFCFVNEPRHDKTNKMSVRPAKTQISLPPCLIRVFAVGMKKPCVLSYPLSAQRRLWSDWADAQADLHLHWVHTHFVGFVMSRLKCFVSNLQHFFGSALISAMRSPGLATLCLGNFFSGWTGTHFSTPSLDFTLEQCTPKEIPILYLTSCSPELATFMCL